MRRRVEGDGGEAGFGQLARAVEEEVLGLHHQHTGTGPAVMGATIEGEDRPDHHRPSQRAIGQDLDVLALAEVAVAGSRYGCSAGRNHGKAKSSKDRGNPLPEIVTTSPSTRPVAGAAETL